MLWKLMAMFAARFAHRQPTSRRAASGKRYKPLKPVRLSGRKPRQRPHLDW
ncbi:MAG: hypothetical protein JNM70_05965 [Anaerolineae bacterium]|nr:hypothetical protein [Anaerolineae bacterium]